MAMGGRIGRRAGLLVAHESHCNWKATYGDWQDGPTFYFEHLRCPLEGWVDAAVRLYPTDPDLTSLCKRYRRRLQERGQFVPWSRKIAQKPMVKELFGALIAFIGYNKTGDLDYAANAARLRKSGFDTVFYYPARMCNYSLGFKMVGDDPIWLDDAALADLRAVPGAHAAPWAWCVEGLDDGRAAMHDIFLHDAQGRPVPNWKIDQFQWYFVCTPYQVEHMKRRFAGDMKAMDWVHGGVGFVGSCARAPE
jgi:hypothetical protein